MADKIATRQAYGEALRDLGAVHPELVVLDADLSGSTMTKYFKAKYPERFFNAGIAEQDMYAMAAGLAASGKTAVASTFAMFASGRAFEIIRNAVAYPHLNVKVCATHAGVTVGEDGASHQCIEDLALMRAIPGMTVINPADAVSAKILLGRALEMNGPAYLRFGRAAVPVVYRPNAKLTIGKAGVLRTGDLTVNGEKRFADVTLIATGIEVAEALEAADILLKKGVYARVLDMHTIKPLDERAVLKAARETGRIVTAEEGTVLGGLGSAVCETIAKSGIPCRVATIGIQDRFGQSGKPAELMKEYGLTAADIVKAARSLLK
ncbi:MAG: transketolase family protein [Firmicutes bacterium]|nr:transketolase family protein [Bacillota bacterium]